MATQFSTGLVHYLNAFGSMKKALHDYVIDVYADPQPSDSDNAPTGTKLVRITYQGGAVTAGVYSTAQKDTITITSATEGQEQIATLNGSAITYTNLAGATTTTVATGLAALINASQTAVKAVSVGTIVACEAVFPGVPFTIAVSGTGSPSTASVTSNVRVNGIQFGTDAAGVLSKESGTWSGTALATGIAKFARVKAASDDDSISTTAIRMDGSCSTINAQFNLSSVNIVAGTTVSVSSCTITQPKA